MGVVTTMCLTTGKHVSTGVTHLQHGQATAKLILETAAPSRRNTVILPILARLGPGGVKHRDGLSLTKIKAASGMSS